MLIHLRSLIIYININYIQCHLGSLQQLNIYVYVMFIAIKSMRYRGYIKKNTKFSAA